MEKEPLILKDRAILRVGKANGLDYIEEELKPLVAVLNSEPDENNPVEMNRDSIFLDHGDGALTWIGKAVNFKWDEDRKAITADLHIVDSDTKEKIEYQLETDGRARFGISPRLTVKNDKGTARDIVIKSLSLVINPAGGSELMLWKNETVLKMNEEKQFVLGAVLVPDKFDLQKEIITREEIEKSAHLFLENLVYGNAETGVMHTDMSKDIRVVESYLMPCNAVVNEYFIEEGTWIIGMKVYDSEIWEKVKKNQLTGFSVQGKARKTAVNE